MESIELIHYQAALIITGTWQSTSRNKLYDERTSDRRWYRRVIQIYKIQYGLRPSDFLLYGSENTNVSFLMQSSHGITLDSNFNPAHRYQYLKTKSGTLCIQIYL